MITEEQLEQVTIDWFQQTGWTYAYGPDLAPEGNAAARATYRDVFLKERITQAVARLNPHLPRAAVEEVVHVATTAGHPALIQNNRTFHRLLLEGVRVEFTPDGTSDKRVDHAKLVDFAKPQHNDFLVVNQFTIIGSKVNRIPDLVLFVNGLPLAVIELKNPADAQADIWKAYNQLQTYKEEISDLFLYNQALVISDGVNARVGSLTANKEWFMPWRTIRNEHDTPLLEYELEKVVRGFFAPDLFLDYIRYFILFEQDGDALIKKIAGYHQFHGVREAVRVTLVASVQPKDDTKALAETRATYGQRVERYKAGVFWHTQGSGKSIAMCCYAGKLLQQPEMNNPTLVVVTDRNDLDGQLFQQFSSAQELLRQTPEQAESREDLRALLGKRQSGGIIFTTIQKFSLLTDEHEHPALTSRTNVVVISDEAHRSQYINRTRLNTKTGEYAVGFAQHMRSALPFATFIGFTGTPIAEDDRDTRAVFGDYISIYDIQDAVDDKATVPIYYESRLAKLDINQAEIEQLNHNVDEVIEDEEDVTEREQTKSRWSQLAKLVGTKARLQEVAADLIAHFKQRTETLEGKAMIVCMSRAICVDLFHEIIALEPAWAGTKLMRDGQEIGYNPEDGAIRVVMTTSASERKELRDHSFTKRQKKRLEQRFKDPSDPLKLVIVRDMWLTGFDAPACHTMYVDKPMHSHNLMQAIARVNRVFKDKPGGLVVDYIGIAAELKQALKIYTDAKGRGTPTLDAHEALAILLEKLDIVQAMFHGFDYSAYATNALALLVPAVNHILQPDDNQTSGRWPEGGGHLPEVRQSRKQRFLDNMAALTKAYALCSTLDEAAARHKEIAFFAAVKAAIVKYTTVDQKRTEEEKNSALKQILDNAIVAEGVVNIYTLTGIQQSNIGLLSDEFLDDVRNMPQRNLAVELLERLLRDEIRAHTRTNVVQEKKYSDRLLATLNRYHSRAIETAQVIEELIAMAKDFEQDLKKGEALGLNDDELAFYMALIENESAVRKLGDNTLKALAVELTEKLRQSTTVDWQVRESVRARLRNLIRLLLRRYKYPPDGQRDAIDLVLQQAEAISKSWTVA